MSENRGLAGLCERVVTKGLCAACGACVSLCPYLRSFQGRIVPLNPCDISEGRCFAYCPRTEVDLAHIHTKVFQRDYELTEMGLFQRVLMARARDKVFRKRAQTGGVVSSLMDFALKTGMISGAILTRRDHNHSPQGVVARTQKEILACAGSGYVAGPTLQAFNAGDWIPEDHIGVVGLPCQVLALGRMRASHLEKRTPVDQVSLVVGLFCTWALDYEPFLAFLRGRLDVSQIQKLDITPPPERILKVNTGAETLDIPLDEIRPFIRPSCQVCADMTAEFSDLSVGTVEGESEWNTVVVRTDRGEEVLSLAEKAGVIETRPLPEENLAHLLEASLLKKRRALEALRERGELEHGYLKDAPQWIQNHLFSHLQG
jgi:coenzyme F420 hydrogenase subunit beta